MTDTRQETCPHGLSWQECYYCKAGLPRRGHTLPPQGAALSNEVGDYSCAACGFGMALPCEHWKTILAEPAVPPVPAEPAQVCRNPNHALTDGTVEPHDIGPSCMAEPRSAEQLTTAANELLRELNKRVFNDAIDITKLHIAVGLCEDFAEAHATILHEFSENAVELASSRKLEIDSLRDQLAAAEREIDFQDERNGRLEADLSRIVGIAQTLHTLLHPEFDMKDCKIAPCDQFVGQDDYERMHMRQLAEREAALAAAQKENDRLRKVLSGIANASYEDWAAREARAALAQDPVKETR